MENVNLDLLLTVRIEWTLFFFCFKLLGKISKEYIALTQDPVAEGILEHYMYFGQEVPGPK